MKVVKNDLSNFLDRVNKVATNSFRGDGIARNIVKKAEELGRSNLSDGRVYSEGSKGSYRLIMEGIGLRYKEFGTGIRGDGTYDGNLPTEPINFMSSGKYWTTKGWEYAYRYKYTDGKGKPHMGFPALMPMYRTSVDLKEYIRNDLRRELQG